MYEFHHDGCSRTSLGRDRVYLLPLMRPEDVKTCGNCGGIHVTKGGRLYLYRYFALSDGGLKAPLKGLFCSVDCCRSYHDFGKQKKVARL